MATDYSDREHREMYDQLMAGKPELVRNASETWRKIVETTERLAGDMERDLSRLGPSWSGSASAEFQNRLTSVVGFSREVSADATTARSATETFATDLEHAQKHAPDPDNYDDWDETFKGALIGTVLGGPIGLVIGGIFGFGSDKAQREAARRAMAAVMNQVGGQYEVSAAGASTNTAVPPQLPTGAGTPTAPGAGPPGSGLAGIPAPAGGPGFGGAIGGPAPGVGAAVPGPVGGPAGPVGTAPAVGVAPIGGVGPGGRPVGGVRPGAARPPIGGGTAAPGSRPAGGARPGGGVRPGAVGRPGAIPAGGRPGGPVGGGRPGAAGSRPGVVGRPGGPGTGTAGRPGQGVRPGSPGAIGRGGGPAGTRPGGAPGRFGQAGRPGVIGSGGGPASGGARGGTGPAGSGRGGPAGGRGALGSGNAMAGARGRGRPDFEDGRDGADEVDDRMTWLTEDDLVWSDGDPLAPTVLDERSARERR